MCGLALGSIADLDRNVQRRNIIVAYVWDYAVRLVYFIDTYWYVLNEVLSY